MSTVKVESARAEAIRTAVNDFANYLIAIDATALEAIVITSNLLALYFAALSPEERLKMATDTMDTFKQVCEAHVQYSHGRMM